MTDDDFYSRAVPHYWDMYYLGAIFWHCEFSVKDFDDWLTAWHIRIPKKYLDKYLTKEVTHGGDSFDKL